MLDGVSLEIAEREFLAVVGPSGSGKSTLLRLVNRLIDPSAGVVRVEGEDVQHVDAVTLRRRIGYVFQGTGLFPHMVPVARGLPALGLHFGPAVRQPEIVRAVAAIGDELQPLAVGDETARDDRCLQQDLMGRLLIVETKAVAIEPDRTNAGRDPRIIIATCGGWRFPGRVIGGMRRVLREGVQDVGPKQFLVLLLVVQAEFDQRHDGCKLGLAGALQQPFHRAVDMVACLRIFSRCSPCALRAGTTMRTPGWSISGIS